MRKLQLTAVAILATAALAASAQTRNEPASSPFVYDAIGATPTIGRKAAAKPADTKPVAMKPAAAASAANATFTYDAVGATPHVDAKKAEAEMSARRLER
jgi:hypothetical protein